MKEVMLAGTVLALGAGSTAHATDQKRHLGQRKMAAITSGLEEKQRSALALGLQDGPPTEYVQACMQAQGVRINPQCTATVGADIAGPASNPACISRKPRLTDPRKSRRQ
jgi:hypothetical protein